MYGQQRDQVKCMEYLSFTIDLAHESLVWYPEWEEKKIIIGLQVQRMTIFPFLEKQIIIFYNQILTPKSKFFCLLFFRNLPMVDIFQF
jgi:hypothetical protein